MKVFVSSTGEDLRDHRIAVIEALLRRGWDPLAMEFWGADPRDSLELSLDRVREADVVVVLVAHRYGTPVPERLGGDGLHSYTWHELIEAERRGLPVFGYVADEDSPWSRPKEADLPAITDADAAERRERVRRLNELKARLRSRSVGRLMIPAQLAADVIVDLSRHAEKEEAGGASCRVEGARGRWRPCIADALQPALHFSGREDELGALKDWFADPASSDRVVALVAIGGTGKTAIAERFVSHVKTLAGEGELPAGLFVWSFYEAPEVDKFLDAAGDYFGGARGRADRVGALERLKAALRGGPPHTFVLDGLERIQGDGEGHRTRGELTDPSLKQLMRLLTSGDLGRARALVTTRFPMADLFAWTGRGYRPIELKDLSPEAARAVLRGWGVRGDDAALGALSERVDRHALSVSVLGSFVGRIGGGDPAFAEKLDLSIDEKASPESARLGRLLVYYREQLVEDERQAMGWFSAFPRGLSIELLAALTEADSDVSGVLDRCGPARLLATLERLRALGLVFRHGAGSALRYSAHPFLREHFRVLLHVPPERAHEVVRAKMAKSLESRPSSFPTDPAVLDSYEEFIEHSRAAGRASEGYERFVDALGGYDHLGHDRGDYMRGRRILEGFAATDDPSSVSESLPPLVRANLVSDWALFRDALGDLDGAMKCHQYAAETCAALSDPGSESVCWRNTCDCLFALGRLPAAIDAARRAQALSERSGDVKACQKSTVMQARILSCLGEVQASLDAFARATSLSSKPPLFALAGVDEAEALLRLDRRDEVRDHVAGNLERCSREGWARDVALCHDVLARAELPQDPASAHEHLCAVRAWTVESGEVELVLRGGRLASMIYLAESNPAASLAEAREGIVVADAHGYLLLAVDLRLAAARAHLAQPDPDAALQRARQALDLSTAPDCGYAWGHADAAHLCGVAHFRLGEIEQARTRLTDALAVRERIRHPGVQETRDELARLPPPARG